MSFEWVRLGFGSGKTKGSFLAIYAMKGRGCGVEEGLISDEKQSVEEMEERFGYFWNLQSEQIMRRLQKVLRENNDDKRIVRRNRRRSEAMRFFVIFTLFHTL